MKLDVIPNQPVIAATRFILRPLRRSDAGLLAMYTSDRRLAEGTSRIPHPLPPGTSEAFVARAMAPSRHEDIWALDGAEHGLAEVFGVISLTRMEMAKPGISQSEIGYWVAPAFWNAGFASEAVKTLIAATPHNARSLFGRVFQDNPASARVLTNCGFQYLGDAEIFSVARKALVPTWTYIRQQG